MWSGAVLSLHWQLLKQLYLTSSGPSMDLSYLLLKRWHEKKTIWKPDPHVVEFLYGWLIVCSSLSSAFQHEGKAHTGPHSPYRIYHMVDRSSFASWRIGMSSRWCNELQTKYRWKAKTCLRPVERPVELFLKTHTIFVPSGLLLGCGCWGNVILDAFRLFLSWGIWDPHPTTSIAAKKLHLHSRPVVMMKVITDSVSVLFEATVNLNHRPWSVSFKAGSSS